MSGLADSNPGPDDSMDVDSEYGESFGNKRIVHSSKRPRISSIEPTESLLKIAGIINLPSELFTEIARYLRPADLLSLSRCCKSLRSHLMNKSYRSLWLDVMKNVKDLPPCPPGFNEPRYLTVLFSGFCTACGCTKKSKMDAILLVRLCDRCQKQCLVRLFDNQVPADNRVLIHKSNVFGKATRGQQLPEARVLKSDVASVVNALGDAKRSGSDHVLKELEKQLIETVARRRDLSESIIRSLELSENEVLWEKNEIQRKRRLEIERRCIDELGWKIEDLHFTWDSPGRKKYYQLLNKADLLYDREWREIHQQLNRLLVANRKARLAKEQEAHERSRSNYEGLGPLFLGVDPVIDGLSHIEQNELLGEICG